MRSTPPLERPDEAALIPAVSTGLASSFLPRAIKALAQRAVEVRPLIQARLPLSKEAVDRAAEPGSGKILIDMTL